MHPPIGKGYPRLVSALLCGSLVAAGQPAKTAESAAAPAPASRQIAAAPPPSAPGYKSTLEVMAAIGLKQIKLITQPTNLPAGVVELKEIEYGTVGNRSLKLDLYRPANPVKPVPGLIFIHGGAWSGGRREIYRFYTVHFAQQGYVAATISYRLSGEAPFPAAVQDAKCAVRWLRTHGAQYHVDPAKIGVIGGSAGGHLAMMVAYSDGVAKLEGGGGNPGVSSRVQAVVDFYGPTDLTTPFARQSNAVKKFLSNRSYDEDPALYRQASPIIYLDKTAPPTLILHGTLDEVVPISQADALAAKLNELGVPCVYDRLEGWPHTMDLAEVVNARCRFFMNEFLAKHLPLPE